MTAYCIVETSGGFFGKNVKVVFGENDDLISRLGEDLIQKTKKVEDRSHVLDILNYMSSIGWELVNGMPFTIPGAIAANVRYLMKIEI